jgi:hypothetical protein
MSVFALTVCSRLSFAQDADVRGVCPVSLVQDAVVKGWFRTSREPTRGGTHLRVVALTAYEVASAMAYLHSHGIAHLVSFVAIMLPASSACVAC